MINTFISQLKNMDKEIWNIIKHGFKFSFVLSLVAILILVSYKINPIKIDTYYIGIELFKTSLSFAIQFIVCGVATDTIKKQLQ